MHYIMCYFNTASKLPYRNLLIILLLFLPCEKKNQLPDVSSTIDSVDELISEEVIDSVTKGQHVLENMRNLLNQTIYENIPQVTNAIRRAGKC